MGLDQELQGINDALGGQNVIAQPFLYELKTPLLFGAAGRPVHFSRIGRGVKCQPTS
jgi:hypothetical protein